MTKFTWGKRIILIAIILFGLLGFSFSAIAIVNNLQKANAEPQASDLITEIKTAQDLIDFANSVSEGNEYTHYIVELRNNIDLGGIDFKPIGENEKPLYIEQGIWSYAFNGEFNGNGYTISNFKNECDIAVDKICGMFAILGGKAYIHDLKLKDVKVNVNQTMQYEDGPIYHRFGLSCGILASTVTPGAIIEQCAVENVIVETQCEFTKNAIPNLGGLIGAEGIGQRYIPALYPNNDVCTSDDVDIVIKDCSISNFKVETMYASTSSKIRGFYVVSYIGSVINYFKGNSKVENCIVRDFSIAECFKDADYDNGTYDCGYYKNNLDFCTYQDDYDVQTSGCYDSKMLTDGLDLHHTWFYYKDYNDGWPTLYTFCELEYYEFESVIGDLQVKFPIDFILMAEDLENAYQDDEENYHPFYVGTSLLDEGKVKFYSNDLEIEYEEKDGKYVNNWQLYKTVKQADDGTYSNQDAVIHWLRPIYSNIIYNIAYELDGGENHGSNPNTYTIDDFINLLDAKKSGYDFIGWKLKGESSYIDTIYKMFGDIVLVANWEARDYYIIEYDLNGGEIPSGQSNPKFYKTTTADFTLINPVKEGYEFLGWSGTEIDGLSFDVTIYQGSTGDRKYIAHWSGEYEYLVLMYKNGKEVILDRGTYTTGESVSISVPNTKGYEFGGWTYGGLYGSIAVVEIADPNSSSTTFTGYGNVWFDASIYALDNGVVFKSDNNEATISVYKNNTLIESGLVSYTMNIKTDTQIKLISLDNTSCKIQFSLWSTKYEIIYTAPAKYTCSSIYFIDQADKSYSIDTLGYNVTEAGEVIVSLIIKNYDIKYE